MSGLQISKNNKSKTNKEKLEEIKLDPNPKQQGSLQKVMDNLSEANDFTDLEEFQFVPLELIRHKHTIDEKTRTHKKTSEEIEFQFK